MIRGNFSNDNNIKFKADLNYHFAGEESFLEEHAIEKLQQLYIKHRITGDDSKVKKANLNDLPMLGICAFKSWLADRDGNRTPIWTIINHLP